MTSEEYGQYIDDFELGADVMPGESLTEYIERRRREFESKADGGSIGIEVLFGPKRDDFRVGGAAGREYGANTSASRGVRTSPSRGPSRDDRGPMLVAELTPKQKKFIDKQKFGLQENLIPARDIFNKITNPKLGIFDTPTFGFGGQEPTTEEEFNEYLKSIGVVQQVKDGGRVGLFMGGPALEGEALSIYNSMNAYGFTDQEIADALSARGLYTPAGSGTTTQPEQVTGIINQQINQGRDTGPTRPTSEIVTDFQETITNRQNKLNNPGKIASFVGDFLPQQRSVADMLASGQVDKRLTSGIPLGIGSMIGRALPDKYYDMSLADQITTQAYMGFTDPNTGMANKDPFGLNVRSAFGNYAEKAAEIVETLEEKLARKGKLSNYDQLRLDHYKNVTKTKQDAVTDLGLINLAKEQAEAKRQEALKKIQAQGKMDYNPNIHGPVNYGKDSQGNQSFDSGMGFGIGSDGGPVSNRTGRGRTGYSEGGLATMFTRRR